VEFYKHGEAMTVRLPTEQAESLEIIAVVEGKHVSDIIRVALAEYQLKRTMDSDSDPIAGVYQASTQYPSRVPAKGVIDLLSRLYVCHHQKFHVCLST